MNIMSASKLMELYAACPACGCEVIGNGKGTIEWDAGAGYFKRTCNCGWFVEVQEGTEELGDPEPTKEAVTVEETLPKPPIEETVAVPGLPAEKEPEPEKTPPIKPEDEVRPWSGFVHIRCEACHKESTTCLRVPAASYTCKECGHEMDLPAKAYRAYMDCECGKRGRYLTNIPDWAFDIPCVNCGSPNTVTYSPRKDCYVPVSHTQRQTKSRKKK